MPSNVFYNSIIAHVLRVVPIPTGRYRYRYNFYQKIKNSGLILHGRIRHSKLSLPLNLGDWIQYWMFMDGAYEKHSVDFLNRHVKGKTFFDVGANVGSYTLSLAKSARHIYSFEASPSNAETLTSFVAMSKLRNVEIINRAVSNVNGETISLYISPDTGGNYTQFNDFGKGCESNTTITLDQFAKDHGIDTIDVIKMDIEGSELAAFQGAHTILSRCHPLLLVEFHALVAASAGWSLSDLYDFLSGYDYRAYELKKNTLTRFEASRLSDRDFYANLIFIHESQVHAYNVTREDPS